MASLVIVSSCTSVHGSDWGVNLFNSRVCVCECLVRVHCP